MGRGWGKGFVSHPLDKRVGAGLNVGAREMGGGGGCY